MLWYMFLTGIIDETHFSNQTFSELRNYIIERGDNTTGCSGLLIPVPNFIIYTLIIYALSNKNWQ